MNGTALVGKVWIQLQEQFLQRADPIGNKALKDISEAFQVNQEPPVWDVSFTALPQDVVDGFLESSIPGNKQCPELSVDTEMLAIKDEHAVALGDVPLRSIK